MATVTGAVSTVSINGNSFYEFTGSGTITYASSNTVPVLIVGGGGGGGAGQANWEGPGGGGGGGVGYGSLTFAAGTTYTITVGTGGTGALYQSTNGTSGSNSSIVGGSINAIAYGGGRGGSTRGGASTAEAGGSSGGSPGWGSAVQTNTKGTGGGLTYLGSNGGTGTVGGSGGGGGGASGAGTSGRTGNGGAGTNSAGGSGYTWSYTNNTYGGGGGGGLAGDYPGFNTAPTAYGGNGGTGGGGTGGGTSAPTAGTAKTGGGGGGACSRSGVGDGAAGGSGVVYIQIVGTIGSAPTITSVTADNLSMSSISVFFTPGTGGSPAPSTYYYSLNGGSTYTNANTTTSPIIISGLIRDSLYNVALIATNVAGNTVASNIVPITITYPCFKQGTRILAFIKGREQYVPVETLKRGDLVKTSKSGYKSISLIGQKTIQNSPDSNIKNRLFRYSQHICPELIEDLCITGEHCALVNVVSDKKLQEIKEHMGKIYTTEGDYRVPAHLDSRAKPYDKEGLYTIWHFALENESPHANYGVYANGLLVESASEEYLQDYSGMKMIG